MNAEFTKARQEALAAAKHGVSDELVCEVLDAIRWSWDHADANVKPKACLLPLKTALKRGPARNFRFDRPKARKHRKPRPHLPGDSMSTKEILHVFKRQDITETYCEILLERKL